MATDGTYLSTRVLTRPRTSYSEAAPIAVVFVLVMLAVWMPPGPFIALLALGTIGGLFIVAWLSRYSVRELGLATPASGALLTLSAGLALVLLIASVGLFTRAYGLPHPTPWHRAWQYTIWAMVQEFMLQSFFFVRLESLMQGKKAVWAAALLFAVTHLPNPLLTPLSFLGALFFCEMFRRYRNLYPLGIAHAALGLTIAASLPDSLLHHMRVGIGYLMYHP